MTRKITRAVAKISLGQQEFVELGNIDSKRDWGHARDYCEGMWRMLQAEKPEDFVLSTGEVHSVREFIEFSFKEIGQEIVWEGSGESEIGRDKSTGKIRVKIDAKFFRPTEVEFLLGDSTKALNTLGWKATTTFTELVKEMVASDIAMMKNNPNA